MTVKELIAALSVWPDWSEVEVEVKPRADSFIGEIQTRAIDRLAGFAGGSIDGRDSMVTIVPRPRPKERVLQ